MYMRQKFLTCLICFNCILFYKSGFADNASVPFKVFCITKNCRDGNFYKLSCIYATHVEKFPGQTLKLKETVAFKSLKVEKGISDSSDSIRFERRAVWAKRLGIGSLIAILIPGLNILSLPAAIIAIVLGTSSIKKVKNKKNARQGITFGIITTAIAVLLIGIVVIVVSFGR